MLKSFRQRFQNTYFHLCSKDILVSLEDMVRRVDWPGVNHRLTVSLQHLFILRVLSTFFFSEYDYISKNNLALTVKFLTIHQYPSLTTYPLGSVSITKLWLFLFFPSPKQFALAFSSLSMVSLFLFVLTETLGYMFEFQCCRSKINLVTIEFNIPITQMKC